MGKMDWALIVIIAVGIAMGILMGGGMFFSRKGQKEKLLTETPPSKMREKTISKTKTGNLEDHY